MSEVAPVAAANETVADLLQAVAHPDRIAILIGVDQGLSRAELVERLELSQSAMSNNLRRLRNAGLVYKPDDAGYRVTPLGSIFAVFLEEYRDALAEAVAVIEDAEERARQEYGDVPVPDDVDRERLVRWRAMELAADDLEDLFDD